MEPQCLVSRGRPKNIVLFEREDVTVMENGVVLTKSLSEIEQIKRKPGRFKTKINFRRDMTSGEVRRTLEENFPTLQNRRFSCAARGTQNSARLEFHGFRRVWDGKTINSKLKGSSVLYLVMEDEPPVSQEALFGTESASSMQGHSRYSNDNSENNQQMSQLLPQSATVTSSGGTDCNSRANPADNINLHEDFFGPSLSPGSFDCEELMDGDFPQMSPGFIDFLDEMDSTQSNRQSQIAQGDLGNYCSGLGSTDQTSGPMTFPAFDTANGTVGTMSPNAAVLGQSQVFAACSTYTDTSGRHDSGFSSEGSSSMDQALDLPHSIPPEAGVGIKPSKGPLEGGGVFQLRFDESLPDAVTSAWATFGNKQVEVWKTYQGSFILHGESIPAGELPGTVPVIITTKNGGYLGKTQFTYVNQDEEILEQIVKSRKMQGKLFTMLGRQCENDENEENNTRAFGLPSDGRQRQAMDILRCLVYTAARIGAEEFIRMIFCTSAGRIVFEGYKKESLLPEDMADANGHEEISTFLRAITKRFSEEETTSQMRSEDINWHELAGAVEESEEQSVAWPSETDVKQLQEDDLFEREYFGDAETSSSDSEKERCDNEDQFVARFSEVSVTEDKVQPASDLSLENDCCDTSAVANSVQKKKQKFPDLPPTDYLSHVVQWLYNTQETDTTDERVDVIVNAANDVLQHAGGTTQTQQSSSGTWDDDAADNFATKGSSSFEVQRQFIKNFIRQVYKHKLQDIEEIHSVEIIWSENASQVQICFREISNNPHSYRKGCDASIDLYRNLHSNMSREVVELKGADDRAFIIEAIKAVESENPVIIEMTDNKLLVFAERNNITSSVQALTEKLGSSQGGSRETRRSQRNTNLSAREHESSQEDRFSAAMQLLSNGVILSLYQSDTTDERVDAIVNAANDALQHGGGVAATIVRKGGRQIKEEFRRIMSYRKWRSLNVGDAVYTKDGNLSCQFVIQTVGPRWNARERSNCISLLHRAWVERLHLAAQSQLCSIALPAISSGIFGMPKSICAQGMFEAIEEFRSNTDAEFSTLRDVRIVIIDDKPIRVSLEKLVKRYTSQETSSTTSPRQERHQLPSSEKRSIALPAISSGIFGMPKSIFAQGMFEAIEEFRSSTDAEFSTLRDVRVEKFVKRYTSRETSSTTSPRQERHQLPSSEKRKACSSLNVTIKHPSFSSADDSSDGQSKKRGKDNDNDESPNKGVGPNMGSNEPREQMPDSIKRVLPSNNKNVPNGNKDNPPNGNKKSNVETEVHGSSKEKGLKGSPLGKGLELSNVTTAAKSPSGSGRGIRAACFCGRPYEEVGSKSSGSTQLAKRDETKSANAGRDAVTEDAFNFYRMMQQSPLLHSRSRRPLSVDDVPVAEAFLFRTSLDDVYESCGDDSGVFLPSPLSSSSSFSCSESTGKLSPDISVSLKTSTPNAHRWLHSYTEDTNRHMPSEPPLEAIFSDINEDIGASWRKLGRHMLKKECFLSNINEDFKGVGEKAYQLLLKWKEEGGASATPQTIFLALLRIRRTDVAKKLIKLLPSLSPLSYLLDSVIASGSILHYSKEDPENLKVEKVLYQKDEKVIVCSSMETTQRFVLKQVEGEENAFAVRKCMDCKALRQKKQQLRKTEEFLKDLEMKQKMIKDLLDVIKELQNHLLKQHQDISEQQFTCQNCGQYKIKQDLVKKELTLLHHELERMSQNRSKRISISGIPSERIYNLATRTYSVCEEHREMHLRSRNQQSVCQHPEEKADSDNSDDHIEGPLMCALNVIIGIGRRRKVTQSLKSKESQSKRKPVSKSNSNPLTSRSRQSYMLAQENPVMMPSFLRSPDWSGVPAFKMSSDFKSPLSDKNSRQKNQDMLPKVSPNPTMFTVHQQEQLSPLQWLKDLEPDELII